MAWSNAFIVMVFMICTTVVLCTYATPITSILRERVRNKMELALHKHRLAERQVELAFAQPSDSKELMPAKSRVSKARVTG